jgi:DNA-binding NarL/FixJ family response regulator
MKKLKILLADDHAVVRNGIKLMLTQQKSFTPIIEEAEDGEEVMVKAKKDIYDVILLDINLPKLNGIAVTKSLTKKSKNTKILALTMHKEDFVIKQMVAAGALGYLLKNTSLDELTKAILTVASSQRYYCNEASQAIINSALKETPASKNINSTIDYNRVLSNREKEIMIYIAREFSSTEIANKLFLSKRTVDGHRKNIITKLDLKNTAGIVKYAIQHDILNENAGFL